MQIDVLIIGLAQSGTVVIFIVSSGSNVISKVINCFDNERSLIQATCIYKTTMFSSDVPQYKYNSKMAKYDLNYCDGHL